ncbi:MAG: response regulator transcription factor [bacterium]
MIRIIVADDHGVVRAGICRLLAAEKDMEIVGEASDGREAVEMCKKLKPDVAVMDYDMPDIDGLEATRQIVELKLGTKIMILTIFDNKEFALSFIKSGASGYLCKKITAMELTTAVRKIAAGDIYFSASFKDPEASRDTVSGKKDLIAKLSNREYQIFIRMARGMTMGEVADDLNVSYSTVKTFKYRIMEKLDLKKDSDMTFYAINKGLIERDIN